MLKNIAMTFMNSLRGKFLPHFVQSASIIAALAVSACTTIPPVAPATPTLISIQGPGTFYPNTNPATFIFNVAQVNAATQTYAHYTATKITFSVPYPTSIELAINGKPLTKVTRPLSTNYEYQGSISNPGNNPATWIVDIRTPFDFYQYCNPPGQPRAAYVLTIVNVSGSNRSQPLSIPIQEPLCYYPPVIVGGGSNNTTHTSDPPSTPTGSPGPCAGGAQEQQVSMCFIQPPYQSQGVTVEACSYADALSLFKDQYAGWGNRPGLCP